MRFNIRVYGILIENQKVLLSEEFIRGKWFTKFPGGGLEFGEGTIDCLKREFMEELDLEINCDSHFYTTDFFVPSAFDESQIMSIYYLVSRKNEEAQIELLTKEKGHRLNWVPLSDLLEEQVSLVIDKKVTAMIKAGLSKD